MMSQKHVYDKLVAIKFYIDCAVLIFHMQARLLLKQIREESYAICVIL